MNQILAAAKWKLREALVSRNLFLGPSTRMRDVSRLIASLRPVAVETELRRFGPRGDGGYLMPDDLDGVAGCISPGVSTEVGFDLDIARLGIDVYMADGSVAAPPVSHERFHFIRKYLETFNSEDSITLDDYCATVAGDADLILQMDIEGAEYRVLTAASERALARFRIMVIEFHDLEYLFSPISFREINAVFGKLLRTHEVVHIHPNNAQTAMTTGPLSIPRLLEFTFYRKDRVRRAAGPLAFPHPLDSENYVEFSPLTLPECWH